MIILIAKKGFNFFNRFFIMRIVIFQDITDYEIWKTKSVERTAEGKRAKHKSDVGLGIRFFKIIIPLEFGYPVNTSSKICLLLIWW
ncbi:spiroplasma plectrovirus-related protein [Spiroplasma phoeniceum P40]|uniref:Spiroplasma plectrovirus-related protein n=1 Tax=Spiroplasma phoeniceum P40 TaxID=1276259 RepID=A0A345DRM9_9MOLU|nr:hypothetical protein [Spiroplasma phoeniceum]AXF96870.1 spiroplasma plectrovirus-related protein [Spiroplasma phoeniceum P40]